MCFCIASLWLNDPRMRKFRECLFHSCDKRQFSHAPQTWPILLIICSHRILERVCVQMPFVRAQHVNSINGLNTGRAEMCGKQHIFNFTPPYVFPFVVEFACVCVVLAFNMCHTHKHTHNRGVKCQRLRHFTHIQNLLRSVWYKVNRLLVLTKDKCTSYLLYLFVYVGYIISWVPRKIQPSTCILYALGGMRHGWNQLCVQVRFQCDPARNM